MTATANLSTTLCEVPYCLGVDWGGTRIKMVAVLANGERLKSEVYRLEPVHAADVDQQVEQLIGHSRALIASLQYPPQAIGLSLTGPVNPEHGVALLPGKISGLEQYPIVPLLHERLQVPVRAQNDGICAMIAERHIGQAQDLDWAVTLTLGTGVGSGVMLDGQILADPCFMFGSQLGHLVMDYTNDQPCLIGAQGTAEMLCSCTALAVAVRSGLQRGISSQLSYAYQHNPHSIDFQAVVAAMEQGDIYCAQEFARWCRSLGWLLVNAVHAYSPQIIILAGGATHAAQHFLIPVQTLLDQHSFHYPREQKIPVRISTLGELASAMGAAMQVWPLVARQNPS